MSPEWRARARAVLGPRWTTRARCLLRGAPLPRWGNLRRTTPFSAYFGFDRGTPIDRHYLHAFLAAHARHITGDVLEIQACDYAARFGHDVRTAESIDVNPAVHPTILCDLADAEGRVPSDRYDCVLLPNTLQHVRRLRPALANICRIAKPGGWILASVAGLLPLIPDGPEYWRLTPAGWRELLGELWRAAELHVEGHGNCLAAIAAMHGLAVEELTGPELDATDVRYPVLITIACRKSA